VDDSVREFSGPVDDPWTAVNDRVHNRRTIPRSAVMTWIFPMHVLWMRNSPCR
jgi:hypothetical protein